MFLIIFAFILVIGLFIGLGLGEHSYIVEKQKVKYDGTVEKYTEEQYKFGWKFRKLVLLAPLGALIVLFGMFQTIDATEVVVVTQLGDIQGVVYEPGLKVKSPLEKYHKYTLKVQEIRYDNLEDMGISFYSNDSQPVDAMLTVQWRIKREQAQTIYEKYGGDVQNVRDRLGSLVMERTKSSLSQYTAEDLISQRSALSVSIETLIVEEINGRGMPVEIVAIYLTDFAFSDAFEAAVEAKMIADQQRLKAETEKQIAIIQAEQQLATTILEAESALEEAKGEANAILAIAQAEAAALSAKVVDVARTLGMPVTSTTDPVTEVTTYTVDTSGSTPEELKVIFDYIQYIEYLNTWNGELPQVITDGSGIIINP